jgi:hypothetical protein
MTYPKKFREKTFIRMEIVIKRRIMIIELCHANETKFEIASNN